MLSNVTLYPAPDDCEDQFRSVMSHGAVQFVAKLCEKFENDIQVMLSRRAETKRTLDETGRLPGFPTDTTCRDSSWKVAPIPRRLQCRHIDLGDVSPTNIKHFTAALNSSAQGIQVDFDDGHCPTWRNQLTGLYNINRAIRNELEGIPEISEAPVLMIRPRSWNMVEGNMTIQGKTVPGPLFDIGMVMYHNGKTLLDNESGPFFYLPKVESSTEAELWDRILSWIEQQLGLPHNCTKVCVLIENILAAFEMEEILYALRDRSAGLNCGLLDYSASILNKFGKRKDFVLPDRSQCLSMDQPFLGNYRNLLIKTCHRRGAYATGGMAAQLLPVEVDGHEYQETLEKVKRMKSSDLRAGVDGFLVYDLGLVEPMQKLFTEMGIGENQLHITKNDVNVEAKDLLAIPEGSITLSGLKHNIKVGLLFIEAWLRGQGCFFLGGLVEDSATAEISRLQVWQWLYHQSHLDGSGRVTIETVRILADEIVEELSTIENFTQYPNDKHNAVLETSEQSGSKTENISDQTGDTSEQTGDTSEKTCDTSEQSDEYSDRLHIATQIFLDILTNEEFIEFITDYLYKIVSVMS